MNLQRSWNWCLYNDSRIGDANKDTMNVIQNTRRTILSMVTRSDGYIFFLVSDPTEEDKRYQFTVWSGCQRRRPIASYRAHARFYGGRGARGKRKETLAILDLFAHQLKTKWAIHA